MCVQKAERLGDRKEAAKQFGTEVEIATVLIVDDEFGIANLFQDVLQDESHRTFTAANGRQALQRVEAERPDVIITDYMMPVADGAALLRALAARPEYKDIPVVMMSSVPEASVMERCSGYALFLRKPFNIFDVLDQISDLIRENDP
jgi:CheY-like chemotaxis protein